MLLAKFNLNEKQFAVFFTYRYTDMFHVGKGTLEDFSGRLNDRLLLELVILLLVMQSIN